MPGKKDKMYLTSEQTEIRIINSAVESALCVKFVSRYITAGVIKLINFINCYVSVFGFFCLPFPLE